MNIDYIANIDTLISKIKKKSDEFGMTSGDVFIILTLEIGRCEISNNGKLTKMTIAALSEIFASTSHFYYYRDFPDLYKHISELYTKSIKIDTRFLSADIPTIGFRVEDWQNYLSEASKILLAGLPSDYYYKK